MIFLWDVKGSRSTIDVYGAQLDGDAVYAWRCRGCGNSQGFPDPDLDVETTEPIGPAELPDKLSRVVMVDGERSVEIVRPASCLTALEMVNRGTTNHANALCPGGKA